MKIGVIDFFSGCGGTSLGLERAGMQVLAGIDSDIDASATYQLNFPRSKFALSDIRHIDVEEFMRELPVESVDRIVFAACAPCQPFSKQRTTIAKADDRIPLLMEFGRFVREAIPDAVLIENVPGIQRFNDGDGPLADFLDLLSELDYEHEVRTIEARSYGVPQRRARLVVLASKHGEPGFPDSTHGPQASRYATVRDWIGELPPISAGETHPEVHDHRAADLSEKNLERIRATPEGGDRRDWPKRLWLDCHSDGYEGHTDVYGRMKWDAPASGLTTRCTSYSNGRFGHPEQDRAISVREAACLQTFPMDFQFVGNLSSQARQIGNAVPVILAEALGRHLLEHLNKTAESSLTANVRRVA